MALFLLLLLLFLAVAAIYLAAKLCPAIGCQICVNPGTEEADICIYTIESRLK
jgi:hypothetical protein